VTLAAALVDQPPQRLEELRNAVDFIENHQAVLEGAQEQGRVRQLRTVVRSLQIQIERGHLLGHCQRQGRLAHLAGTKQRYGCLAVQGLLDDGQNAPRYHPCKLHMPCSICKSKRVQRSLVFGLIRAYAARTQEVERGTRTDAADSHAGSP